jgi:hypothetical protein
MIVVTSELRGKIILGACFVCRAAKPIQNGIGRVLSYIQSWEKFSEFQNDLRVSAYFQVQYIVSDPEFIDVPPRKQIISGTVNTQRVGVLCVVRAVSVLIL